MLYKLVQLQLKEKHLTKAEIGHFKKNGLNNYRHLQEFRVENPADYKSWTRN